MRLIICIAACSIAAVLGSLLTTPSLRPWYANLKKPVWTPPSWLFGPAWTVLFITMAISAWLVWRRVELTTVPMLLFLIQLLLNILWSGLFFALRSPGLALLEIVLLWWAILAVAISSWKVFPPAGWLLLPYLAWVTFAAALNFSIWRLNA